MKNSRKSSFLACDLCGGRGAKIRYVTRSYGNLVRGGTLDESKQIVVVAKLGPTGKLVIITIYEE